MDESKDKGWVSKILSNESKYARQQLSNKLSQLHIALLFKWYYVVANFDLS